MTLDPICPICQHPFLSSNGRNQVYCDNCIKTGAVDRMKYRIQKGVDEVDDGSISGSGGGFARWVKVVSCPKDSPMDVFPPFRPGVSRFPTDQFLRGLHDGIWPQGMRIDVEYFTMENGKKKDRWVKRYTVPGEKWQKRLAEEMNDERRVVGRRKKNENETRGGYRGRRKKRNGERRKEQ